MLQVGFMKNFVQVFDTLLHTSTVFKQTKANEKPIFQNTYSDSLENEKPS